MAYSLVNGLALVLAVAIILKMTLFYFQPKSFYKYARVYLEDDRLRKIYLGLFLVLFYFLMQEMTPVQFAAAILVGGMLYGHTLLHFPKEMTAISKKIYQKKEAYLPDTLIWLILAFWILRSLLM
jgi:predicted RND superfamily exporter protein